MAEKARLQVKGTLDPEKWEDVGAGSVGVSVPVAVESSVLPTGAATSDYQITISGNQVDGDQKTQIVDSAGRVAKIDPATYSLHAISYEHHEIHAGSSFTTSYKVNTGNGGIINLLVVTPDTTKWSHFTYEIDGELETDIILYEGATASNNGTPVAVFNRDRNSLTAATTLVFDTPTVAGGAEGTVLRTWHFGSNRSYGGGDRGTHELILKQNTKYLLRVTNSTANDNFISIKLDWYEHTNL